MNDVAGARYKLERADKHIEDFKFGISDFLRDNGERVVHDPDPTGLQKAKFLRADPNIPEALVCMVGDAAHNLRSALDHLAYTVAKWNGASIDILERVNFTIREKPIDFNAAIKERQIACIGAPWIDFITRVEPYYGGKGVDLFVVSSLDNIDKHRNLLVLGAFIDTVRHIGDGLYHPVRSGIPIKDGVEIFLDPTDPNYATHHRTRIVIGEMVAGLDKDAFAEDVLDKLSTSVRNVIDSAAAERKLWP